jgi:hypothetical protein
MQALSDAAEIRCTFSRFIRLLPGKHFHQRRFQRIQAAFPNVLRGRSKACAF